MKKVNLVFAFFIFSFVLSTPVVLAQTRNPLYPTLVQKRLDKQTLLEKKREELKDRLEVKKATREAQLTQLKLKIINNYWDMMEKRLSAAITRLEKLLTRLESRVAKMKSEDPAFDSKNTELTLTQAKQKLADTKVKLETADTLFAETLKSENPKEAFPVVRKTVEEIKKDLIDTHVMLVHLIGDLKGLRVGSEEVATPSAQPTNTD